MRKGKLASQVAHASMKVLLDRGAIGYSTLTEKGVEVRCSGDGNTSPVFIFSLTPAMQEWLSGAFVKIVVGVNSEAEMLALEEKARGLNIPCAIIKDNGTTEFHGVPTYTALAIGPAEAEIVDQVTGHLKLL